MEFTECVLLLITNVFCDKLNTIIVCFVVSTSADLKKCEIQYVLFLDKEIVAHSDNRR